MDNIINKLFFDYLDEQNISKQKEYVELSKRAMELEKELRMTLDNHQDEMFFELFELTADLHFLEVKDAFFNGCQTGATATQELMI